MKRLALFALGVVGSVVSAFAADPPGGSAPKGTICYSNNLAVAGEQTALIGCKGVGRFTSVSEIYERGYRVVSSGFLPETRNGLPPLTTTIYLIIEVADRK